MSALKILPPHTGVQLTTWRSKLTDATQPSNNKFSRDGHPFVVLITGAGKGIGYHIALSYARAGATGLIITSRTQSDLDELAEQLHAINADLDILSKAIDTSDAKQVADLALETRARFNNHLDIVVPFAGVVSKTIYPEDSNGPGHLPGGLEDNDFQRVMNINVTGTWYIAQHFVPILFENPNPKSPKAFIASSSTSAHSPHTLITPASYNLSRFATTRMCEMLHNDYHVKTGLQAFAIAPGHVRTAMTNEGPELINGRFWEALLTDDADLCGGFLTWLTRERREWLSGRLLNANYDVEELEKKKDEIVKDDKLKFRQIV